MSDDFTSTPHVLYASVDGMINDALDTIKIEIVRLHTKVKRGVQLNPTEAKLLQGYVKCLVDLSKEDRERARDADLSNMSTEELLAAYAASVKRPAPLLKGSKDE
jgi:hypothetical protein